MNLSVAKNPTKYLSIDELYADQLQSLKLGYALYEPDPGEGEDEVHVGDVGYVYHGRFKTLYNVFSSELRYPAIETRFQRVERFADLDEGVLSSDRVSSRRAELQAEGSEPVTGASAGLGIKLSCNSECGASLFTRHRSKVERSPFPDVLKEHYLKYVHVWLAEAQRQGKPVKHLQDLILVTGRVMTGDWATIAFSGRTEERGITFNMKGFTVSASGTLWGRWSEYTTLPKRHGPLRQTPIADGEEPPLSQCVFIETFRAYDRPWYAKLKSAITLRWEERQAAKQPPKEIDAKPTTEMAQGSSDSKLAPQGRDELSDMPEVLSVYDALAFQAFEEVDFDADLMCIDEEDVKRTASTFGTYSVIIDDLEKYEDHMMVERVDNMKEPEGLRVGRISHEIESLLHILNTSGSLNMLDDPDMDLEEYQQLMEQLSEMGLMSISTPFRALGRGGPQGVSSQMPDLSAFAGGQLSNVRQWSTTQTIIQRGDVTEVINSEEPVFNHRIRFHRAEDYPNIPAESDKADDESTRSNSDAAVNDEDASKAESSKSPTSVTLPAAVEESTEHDDVHGIDPDAKDAPEPDTLSYPLPHPVEPTRPRVEHRAFEPGELAASQRRNEIWEKQVSERNKSSD